MSNKRDINAVVQLLGMLGIIISLIFVGLEMRQSQRIAIAGQYQARAAMNAASIQAAIEAGIDFNAQSGLSQSNLTPEEQVQQRNFTNLAYTRIENDYYQYQQGLIDEETWEKKLFSIRSWYNNCDLRGVWERRSQFFTTDLIDLIKSEAVDC